MNILYYNCFAGISGDMNLAALIDLGVAPDHLRAELSRLGLDHEFELRVTTDFRKGIRGTRVDVALTGQDPGHDHGGNDSHHHDHHDHGGHDHHALDHGGHDHAGHDHGGHAHHAHGQHEHHPPQRNLRDIEALLDASTLADNVRETSRAIFRRLARAEARVHGKPVEEVHFHEVGATDSIVDIVGAAICFHRLGVDQVWCSSVELGGGFARCAHGLIPVPAPATLELLAGVPTTRGAVRQEATTPTGAAILAALVDRFTDAPALTLEKTGYGVGHRDTDIPNLLQVHLARADAAPRIGTARPARLLQCNIDDMTAEMLGAVMDLFLDAGAMDVHFTPILMKKNRPATCVSLLCSVEDEERFKGLFFRHTTTLGVKSFPLEKTVLDIAFEPLDTPLGPVTMKNALLGGQVLRSKPELEDCRALALRHGIPLGEVYRAVGKARP